MAIPTIKAPSVTALAPSTNSSAIRLEPNLAKIPEIIPIARKRAAICSRYQRLVDDTPYEYTNPRNKCKND